jgi:glycosyltransferase involved in cell wall biosynthesis
VLAVAHSCVMSWWEAVHGTPPPPAWSRYAAQVRRSLAGAGLVAAPSRAMLDALVRCHGPLPSTRVIRNGRREIRVARTRREPLVLAAGRLWDEAKNLAALAAVAPRLPWRVCIAGAERSPDGAEAALPNVERLGVLDEAQLAARYRRAAIYALPARYEPFGLSVLEAAQAGCALVLGDIASLRENWDGASLFVAPDDHDALAAAIGRLVQDESLRARLGAAARQRARGFTPAAMAATCIDAYRSLRTSRQAPPTPCVRVQA